MLLPTADTAQSFVTIQSPMEVAQHLLNQSMSYLAWNAKPLVHVCLRRNLLKEKPGNGEPDPCYEPMSAQGKEKSSVMHPAIK